MKTYTGMITHLDPHQVFVFGANLQGFHGAGSAGYASFGVPGNRWREFDYASKPVGWQGLWNKKGFIYLQQGREGRSYGLPTVVRAGARRSLPGSRLMNEIARLYDEADYFPSMEFLVAQGHKPGLNGYSAEEMAGFFARANNGLIPENILFEERFAALVQKELSIH